MNVSVESLHIKQEQGFLFMLPVTFAINFEWLKSDLKEKAEFKNKYIYIIFWFSNWRSLSKEMHIRAYFYSPWTHQSIPTL